MFQAFSLKSTNPFRCSTQILTCRTVVLVVLSHLNFIKKTPKYAKHDRRPCPPSNSFLIYFPCFTPLCFVNPILFFLPSIFSPLFVKCPTLLQNGLGKGRMPHAESRCYPLSSTAGVSTGEKCPILEIKSARHRPRSGRIRPAFPPAGSKSPPGLARHMCLITFTFFMCYVGMFRTVPPGLARFYELAVGSRARWSPPPRKNDRRAFSAWTFLSFGMAPSGPACRQFGLSKGAVCILLTTTYKSQAGQNVSNFST